MICYEGIYEVIGIRADANKTIATGHVMRCMTIAREIINLGEQVVFIVADKESETFVNDIFKDDIKDGFECTVLNSTWSLPVEEVDKFASLIKEKNIRSILFDSYSFDADYFFKLKESIESQMPDKKEDIILACMNDVATEKYPVDIFINYNAYATTLGYDDIYTGETRLLLGLNYAPLREQFTRIYNSEHDMPENVLVAAGGGDVTGILLDILEEAQKEPELARIDFHAVVGSMTDDQDDLMRLAWCCENIFLHRNVTDMAKLMSQCDAAISAAGTMLTELCCMKVPTIEYAIADNQLMNAEYYKEHGLMIGAGDMRSDRSVVVKRIVRELKELVSDRKRLATMRRSLEGICDGRGAKRIAQELCS